MDRIQDALDATGQYWIAKRRFRLAMFVLFFAILLLIVEESVKPSASPLILSLTTGIEIILLLICILFMTLCWIDGYKAEKVLLVYDAAVSALLFGWILTKSVLIDGQTVLLACAVILLLIVSTVDFTTQRLKTSRRQMNLLQMYRQRTNANVSQSSMDGSRTGLESIYTSQNYFQAVSPAVQDEDIRVELKEGNANDIGGSLKASQDMIRRYSGPTTADLSTVSSLSTAPVSIDINDPSEIEFDGFRVKLTSLPQTKGMIPAPENVSWDSFEFIEHRIDSSSCHIYTAFWQDMPVIIKLIKADRVTSAMAVAEFEMEATILSRVQHPNIVRLLGSGVSPRRFLILELLDGGSLSHALGIRPDANKRYIKRKFTYKQTLQMARSIASALDYLHNRWNGHIHIIHRDLKPDNIGWTSDGQLKVFDFGLCTCVRTQREKKEHYRLTGNTGTLRYMAPEVALGRSYNKSVDTYSFGIILWQVFKMQLPFKHMHKKDYMEKVVMGGQRPTLDRRWPKRLRSLLEGCWHEDKSLRPDFSVVLEEIDYLIKEVEEDEMHPLNRLRNFFLAGILSMSRGIIWSRPGFLVLGFAVLLLGFALLGVFSQDHSRVADQVATLSISIIIIAFFCSYAIAMTFVRGTSKRPLSSRDLIMGLELNQNPSNKHFNPMAKDGEQRPLYGL